MAYGQQMTPEERMMAMLMQRQKDPYGITTQGQVQKELEQLDPRNLEAAGGMSMPPPPDLSSSPEQDALSRMTRSTGGMESRLKGQQAYADSLRATPGAKLQRVGPSNIAVANPWEGLEVGFNRALGGYLSSKLGDDYDAVDAAKTDKARATAEYEASLLKDERAYTTGQNDQDRGLRQAIADAGNNVTMRGQDMSGQQAAAVLAGQNARDVTLPSFFNPRAGEPGEPQVLTYRQMGEQVVDNNGQRVDITGMAPYSAVSPQSLDLAGSKPTAAQAKADAEGETQLGKLTGRFANIRKLASYTAQEANDFTGINPQALLGKFALGPDGKRAQQFQKLQSVEEIGGLVPSIAEAKLTPVSDTDVRLVREEFVNSMDQPETTAQFYAYNGRQFMERTVKFNEGKSISAVEGKDIMAEYDRETANLALRWGYAAEDLITAGYDPKLVAYTAEKIRRESEK